MKSNEQQPVQSLAAVTVQSGDRSRTWQITMRAVRNGCALSGLTMALLGVVWLSLPAAMIVAGLALSAISIVGMVLDRKRG